MSFYADGNGFIVFKEVLSPELYQKVLNELSVALETDAIRDPQMPGFKPHQTYVGIWNAEKYYGKEVLQALDTAASIAEIDEGVINYKGEDNSIWRFIYKDGEWIEENGEIVFFNTKKEIGRLSHAFYTVLCCLEDNLPDADDEYSEWCMKIYRDTLSEFTEASNNIAKGLDINK